MSLSRGNWANVANRDKNKLDCTTPQQEERNSGYQEYPVYHHREEERCQASLRTCRRAGTRRGAPSSSAERAKSCHPASAGQSTPIREHTLAIISPPAVALGLQGSANAAWSPRGVCFKSFMNELPAAHSLYQEHPVGLFFRLDFDLEIQRSVPWGHGM